MKIYLAGGAGFLGSYFVEAAACADAADAYLEAVTGICLSK
jgi:nucleoside-diphosphate-sugar epimerase